MIRQHNHEEPPVATFGGKTFHNARKRAIIIYFFLPLSQCLLSSEVQFDVRSKADETFMGNLIVMHRTNRRLSKKFYTPIRYAGLPKLKLSTSRFNFAEKLEAQALALGIFTVVQNQFEKSHF